MTTKNINVTIFKDDYDLDVQEQTKIYEIYQQLKEEQLYKEIGSTLAIDIESISFDNSSSFAHVQVNCDKVLTGWKEHFMVHLSPDPNVYWIKFEESYNNVDAKLTLSPDIQGLLDGTKKLNLKVKIDKDWFDANLSDVIQQVNAYIIRKAMED